MFSPKQIIFPGALVETPGFSPTSSIIIGIVCWLVQPKLSVIWTVTVSPFWIIGGLTARFLVAPDFKFKVLVVVLDEIVVALTIKV